jgi:hypothetical protein
MTGHLNSRYGSTCGGVVATALSTIYTNWHAPRTNAVANTGSIKNVCDRYTSGAQTNVNSIITGMSTLSTNFTNVYGNLTATLSPITDPNNGMIAGLNCLVLGEDLVLAKNTFCVTMFNSFYFLFVTIGTSSFALLFGLCCIVCSGVRHYKQNEKKNGLKTFNDKSFNDKR